MFDRLNARTGDALDLIQTGDVRWSSGMGASIRFDIPSGEVNDYGMPLRRSIDLSFLSERLYSRDGWETSEGGTVTLTRDGIASLADLCSGR